MTEKRTRGTRLWPEYGPGYKYVPPPERSPHGSIYKYRTEAVRHKAGGPPPCRVCKAAYKAYRVRMKENTRARGPESDQFTHGTEYGYRAYNCRCERCRRFMSWSRNNSKRKKKGWDPIPWREDWKIEAKPFKRRSVVCGQWNCLSWTVYRFLGGNFCVAHRPLGVLGTVVTHDDGPVR